MSSIGIVQSAVKKVQQVGVDFVQVQVVASAVLAILVVALSAYGRRCRHPALRLIISGASIAFIPLTSSAINALLGQRKMLKLLKECEDPTCKGGKYSPEVQTMWTLLLWSVLILIIKGNADTAAASAAAASASPSSGDVGVDGQKVRTPVELLATYAVVVWLIVECIPEAEWLKFEGKAIFVVFFLLGFAKVVLKLVAFLMASNSYAIGKNARLVSGYMAQLVEEGAEDGHGHVPPYLVVGESKEHVEEKPQGYRIKRESDPVKKNKDKLGALITLDRVWTLSDHGDGFLAKKLELRDLCLSFSLFKSLRRRLSGYPLTEEGSSNALDFVLRGMDTAAGDGKAGVDAKRVFRVLVDELWFASDFYYSPLPLCSFSGCGWCAALNYLLSVLIIAGAIGVGVLYQIRRVIVVGPDRAKENPAKGPELYQVAYYFITLFLLLAAVLTEACEIIAGVCSNWTKMALIGHYIRSGTLGRWTNAALDTVLRFRPAKRWSDEIGQTSVLEPRRFGRRSGLFSEKLYGRAGLMRSVEVSQAVKDAVLRSLKSSYGGLDKGSTLAAHRMVLFVAPSKNVKGHVEAMGRGGEFVTLVWALLMHAGVTDRPGTADGTGVP
uniref:Uncharacterized protein n=1 Tax=Aegilops tauschii TaxID=37682 RepID=M8BXF6_AEGTA